MKRYRRCSRGYRWLFIFLLLNLEHGVNNECSQSIQSVRHTKRTHHMWPHQKDRSMRKRKEKKKERKKRGFLAHSAQLAVQSNNIDQVRGWNGVLPRGSSLFRIISSVISGNRLFAWRRKLETDWTPRDRTAHLQRWMKVQSIVADVRDLVPPSNSRFFWVNLAVCVHYGVSWLI